MSFIHWTIDGLNLKRESDPEDEILRIANSEGPQYGTRKGTSVGYKSVCSYAAG